MIFENGEPKDFIYLMVNDTFETLTHLTGVVGKRVTEVIPGIREADPELFQIYGRVALTGQPHRFEIYVKALSQWFSISVYSPESPYFVAVFDVITERKQTEARLVEHYERFRRIMENTDAGYFRIGTDGCFENVNPAWLRMHGFARKEDAIGLHFSAVHIPEDLAEAQEIVETLMRGEARRGELSTLRQDGTIAYQTFSANPVLDGDRVVGLEGFLVDITAWKTAKEEKRRTLQRANEAVAKAEAHYRLMFNSVSDAVFVHKFGEDGLPSCFLEVNDNACRLLGYTREELLQMRVVDIIAPEEDFNGPANARRLLADGHATWEGRLAAEDGRLIPAEVNARVFNLDGSPTVISSVRDISERKQAEAALRESEERHRGIVQTAMEGFWLTNSEGRLLEVNETYCRMSGYSAEELLTMCISDLVDNQTAGETAIRIKRLMSQSEARFESRHRRKDGSTFAVEASVQYRPVAGGRFVCFLRDITEHIRAEAERAKLEDQLRQAQRLESVGRLAGGVAHDFNNLLTVINGYSGFLLKKLRAKDPLRSYAAEIKIAGERATSLTKQLLAFSRKQIIETRAVDINRTIRESAPMLQRLIGEDIALVTHLDDSLGQVLADPDQIHQVIMNLAVNARDAMADGGTLDFKTMNIEIDEAASDSMHHTATPGRYVLMTVSDNGHGMDETIRQQIFEPFFTTKEVGKGTGLGLSMVYGIIRQGGGWIDVWSEVGVGTSFTIFLPRIDGQPVPESDGSSDVTENGAETILIVEDQSAVLAFTGAALRQCGYTVLEASDGNEAIAVTERHSGRLDLLLTDVVMPGMNGKELSECLKKLCPNLKVLFISGYTSEVIAHRGVLDRGVALLHKRFSTEELAAKVRDTLADL